MKKFNNIKVLHIIGRGAVAIFDNNAALNIDDECEINGETVKVTGIEYLRKESGPRAYILRGYPIEKTLKYSTIN